MSEIDPRGLEAALDAFRHEPLPLGWTCEDRERLKSAIRAYLGATRPEGEPDKIAVVVDWRGRAFGATYRQATPDEQFERLEWMLTVEGGAESPFAHAIVECHLPRPAEPVTVQGRVA